jgi:hypothetical protein
MKRKSSAGISLLFKKKTPMGPPGLTSSSDGRMAVNSTYAFTSHAVRRDLGFNPVIFGTETSF